MSSFINKTLTKLKESPSVFKERIGAALDQKLDRVIKHKKMKEMAKICKFIIESIFI
jgi:hypothetical protein